MLVWLDWRAVPLQGQAVGAALSELQERHEPDGRHCDAPHQDAAFHVVLGLFITDVFLIGMAAYVGSKAGAALEKGLKTLRKRSDRMTPAELVRHLRQAAAEADARGRRDVAHNLRVAVAELLEEERQHEDAQMREHLKKQLENKP